MGVGVINAFFIAKLKVPSIIVTLGTMMLARGVAQVITQGAQRNTSLPDSFGVLGSLNIPGTSIRLAVLVMFALVILAFVFEKKTVYGSAHLPHRRQSRGGARLSGINVRRRSTPNPALHPQRPAGSAKPLGIPLVSESKGRACRAGQQGSEAPTRWSFSLLGGVSIAGGFGSALQNVYRRNHSLCCNYDGHRIASCRQTGSLPSKVICYLPCNSCTAICPG